MWSVDSCAILQFTVSGYLYLVGEAAGHGPANLVVALQGGGRAEQHEEEARGKGDLGQVAEVDRVSQPDEGAQRIREEINLSNKNAANRF